MNSAEASKILGNPAGHMIAHKKIKAYEVWVWEGGVTKVMGNRQFGWHPDYKHSTHADEKVKVPTFYFALDNRLPIVHDGWCTETWERYREAIKIVEAETRAAKETPEARRAAFRVVETAAGA